MTEKDNPKILLVEDDASFNILLRTFLSKCGWSVTGVLSGGEAVKSLRSCKYDIVLTDLRLPDTDGLTLLKQIKEQEQDTIVIMMTGYADVQTAVQAIKLGAYDYLEKPADPQLLKAKITEVLRIAASNKPAKTAYIKGESPASRKLWEGLMLVAPTMLSVLITGDSGTGKEYVANQIHHNSPVRNGPFVAVDCGAIPKDLAASELFGHVKGAFTSAISDKKGAFELAQGGTLFLDEIGNLNPDVQMQLLRALQEGIIKPVGGMHEIAVHIRVLAATNIDLTQAIAENKFREDLYHRINEFPLHVPLLRDRGRDILLFAEHFLGYANKQMMKHVQGFAPEAEEKLLHYPWWGNLRELRNVINRTVLVCRTDYIQATDLPEELRADLSSGFSDPLLPLKDRHEKKLIIETLQACAQNRSFAARLLGMDRKTLYNKMKKYGIS